MEINLTIIFLMAVVFVFRTRLLKKIKANNRYCDPSDNIYVVIPSIKVLDAGCFSFVVLCMAAGLFLFEFYYATADSINKASWYVMIGCTQLSGLYYGLMLHAKYFYFTFGEDYIEFNLKIGKRSKDAIKICLQELESINKETDKYCIKLKDQNYCDIYFGKLEYLVGSELLKKRLERIYC